MKPIRPTSLATTISIALAAGALLCAPRAGAERDPKSLAGSVQLNYMAVPTESVAREHALDGSTVELSLKLAMDFSDQVSSSVKVCVACHGMEVGLASFDLRVVDELNFRVGRFTPAFGEFPARHDPANHRTSDKPLPYDMGRMLRINEWNMSVLPAPWVDNGLEVNGTHFFGSYVQADYAVYAIGGPRAGREAVDLDFKQSRSPESYYIDNNSRPTVGAHLAWSLTSPSVAIHIGGSGMAGTYDPENQLDFLAVAAYATLGIKGVFLRAEYVGRQTRMFLGERPADRFRYGPGKNGEFDPYFVKDGFYTELEVPVGRVDFVLRWDGMRRRGNVVKTSALRSHSAVLRYTAGTSVVVYNGLRLKLSGQFYDFSDFDDAIVAHLGLAGPF